MRDLFRSGSSTLDSDNRRFLPACDPVSISDVDAPGDWEGKRAPPPAVNRLPARMNPVLGTTAISDGPAGPGEPSLIDI